MNKTGWIIFSTVVVLLLGGLVVWTRLSDPPIDISGVNNNSVIAASQQNGSIGDHVTGSDAKKILLIEYGDFQCPSCGGAYPNVKSLMDQYGKDVSLVFRNFPLTANHPNARAAAAAAEAAGLQGKFWDMYNKLYTVQNIWSGLDGDKRTAAFQGYAKELGLDINKFNSDVTGQQVSQKIKFDMTLGKSVGVNATPTFFLNGQKLDDETAGGIVKGDLTKVKAKLDALIAEKK